MTQPMTMTSPGQRTARAILVSIALLLPTLSLVPLGGLYLYEHGWLLHWAAAALVLSGGVFLLERSRLRSGRRRLEQLEVADAERVRQGHMTLADRAWADVRTIARRVDPDQVRSLDDVLALGQRTIDAVARRMYPEKKDALWQFTLPEALAICERVSARLGGFVETQVPFGDRLTVAQLMSIYRWRGIVGVAERAYDVWRVIRMANPATAVTHEAREQLSRAVLNWSKERVGRRIAEAYVEEVGRAAIDLYGGRLRPHGETQPAAEAPDVASKPPEPLGPIRVAVAGAASDRAMIAAALGTASVEEDGRPLAVTVSDAIGETRIARRQLLRRFAESDVVAWAISAKSGLTAGDEAALEALTRAAVEGRQSRLVPLVAVIVGQDAMSASEIERIATPLVAAADRGGWPLPLILPLTRAGPARRADVERLVAAINEEARRAPVTASPRRTSRGGLFSAARQAVSAAGSLAGHVLWRGR